MTWCTMLHVLQDVDMANTCDLLPDFALSQPIVSMRQVYFVLTTSCMLVVSYVHLH